MAFSNNSSLLIQDIRVTDISKRLTKYVEIRNMSKVFSFDILGTIYEFIGGYSSMYPEFDTTSCYNCGKQALLRLLPMRPTFPVVMELIGPITLRKIHKDQTSLCRAVPCCALRSWPYYVPRIACGDECSTNIVCISGKRAVNECIKGDAFENERYFHDAEFMDLEFIMRKSVITHEGLRRNALHWSIIDIIEELAGQGLAHEHTTAEICRRDVS
jgi:hypothetical protein